MKVCTCFLLFGIFAFTHSFASSTLKSNQRSVNLALETVLEFNNKDKENDIKFINNVQNFLTKVKTVIDDKSNDNNLRRNFKAPRLETFTGFIQDAIHILNTYEDSAFANFFDILDKEIRNYHYRGCRFYELTENYEIRKLIAAKLDSIKGKPTSFMRAHIKALSDMLKDGNYDRNFKEIVHYINSLYRQEAGEKFQNILSDLEAYGSSKSKRSNNNLGKIIKNGVRSIIFDHYTNLNTNVRRDVKQKLETFCKQSKKNPPSRGNILNVKPYSKYRKNAKLSENIKKEVKKPKPASRKDFMNTANANANRTIEVVKNHENNEDRSEIKQFEYKKAEMKEDNEKHQKNRYNYTKQDTVDKHLGIQEKETKLISQHSRPIDQQETVNEHQDHPGIDSLSEESFSSIEFYHEPQDDKQQYSVIIPVEISQKPLMNLTKKPESIEALNVTTRTIKNNTDKNIWIEESTGRLPKAVLDKLAIKPSEDESRHNMTDSSLNKRGPKHKKKYGRDQKKWHGKIYDPKYDKMNGQKYNKTHDKKRMTKHSLKNETKYEFRQNEKSKQNNKHKNDKTSKPNDPFILVHNRDFFRQNHVRTTDSVFNMEIHQYKKSMMPVRVEFKSKKRWSTASTKAQKFLEVLDVLMSPKSGKTMKSLKARRTAAQQVKSNGMRHMRETQQVSPLPSTNSFMGRLSVAVPKTYIKRNKISSRKSGDYLSSSNEGMTVEKSDIKDDIRRHGQNAKRTSSSLEKDPFVIKRIRNLERQLNGIKKRINVNTDVVKARKDKRTYLAKGNIVTRKHPKTRFKSDINMIPNYFKDRRDLLKKARNASEKVKESGTTFRSYKYTISNNSKASTDMTKEAKTEDNKANVKYIDLKNREEIVVNDHQTVEVTRQQAILKEDKEIVVTSRTNVIELTPKAKDRGITVVMNHHDGDDASKETGAQNKEVASLNTLAKATESITKTTTTVQPTVAVSTPDVLKLSTISVSTSVATSVKLAAVLHKDEFNVTVDESKNKIAYNTSQVTDVSETTLSVTKEVTSKLIN